MDKQLRELKQSMDNTVFKDLEFNEKHKQFVRAAITKKQQVKQRKKSNVPYIKYAFSVAASFVLLIGALYFVMNSAQSGQNTKHNISATNHPLNSNKITSRLVGPKQGEQQYTIQFADGVTSEDIKSTIINHYKVTIQSFSHHYVTSDKHTYKGTHNMTQGETFEQAVTVDKQNLTIQIKDAINALNKKANVLKQMLNDPKSKGKQGVSQKAVNQMENAIKDRQRILQQVETKPLSINTMVIQASASEAKKLQQLAIVTSVKNGVRDNTNVSPSQQPKADYINKVDMMTLQLGWGTSSNDIIKTSDKGKTWVLVNPKGITNDQIVSSTFLSDKIALVFAKTSQGNVVLFRTIDGGKQWVSFNTPFASNIFGATEFISDLTSWVYERPGQFYKTTSGGKTWNKIPISTVFKDKGALVGGVTFINNKIGWLSGGYAFNSLTKPWIYQTNNGGKTWTKKNLPEVTGLQDVQIHPVKLFSSKSGVLPVQGWLPQSQSKTMVFYHTTNLGKTWQPSHIVKPLGATSAYDFINMNDGWVIDYKNIYTTHDGGVTWSTHPYTIKNYHVSQASYVILDLEMTSTKTGLMVVQDIKTMKSDILTTNDGGKIWTISSNPSLMKSIVND